MTTVGKWTRKMNRRCFLWQTAMTAPLLSSTIFGRFEPKNSRRSSTAKLIAELELDLHNIHKWDDSNGDTWDPFWADDGQLYAFNCDGRGFGTTKANLALNRWDGETLPSLTGTQINAMTEYGRSGQHGKDNATWKACGQECIDGVFYAFVSRNVYGKESQDPLMRQTAANSSLIKSLDRGLTWTRSAEENYAAPMWEGPQFGAPFFVHYGRNGGQVDSDGARDYVYAVSTNGFWNDGDKLILGRVERKLLPRLQAKDWEYLSAEDGALAQNWSREIAAAAPILKAPGKCSQTPITYVADPGIYLLISWYNPQILTKWFNPTEMRYDFYQAQHPWGPWSLLHSFSDNFLAPGSHMYGPALCAKYQESGAGQTRIAMFTSGCPFEDVPTGIYKAWMIPVVLRTEALPAYQELSADSPSVHFAGAWTKQTEASNARVTKQTGDSLTLSFAGTGAAWIAQKTVGAGTAEVLIDGTHQETVHLALTDFPALSGVTVFQRNGMPRHHHRLQIIAQGDGPINMQGLRVYR